MVGQARQQPLPGNMLRLFLEARERSVSIAKPASPVREQTSRTSEFSGTISSMLGL